MTFALYFLLGFATASWLLTPTWHSSLVRRSDGALPLEGGRDGEAS